MSTVLLRADARHLPLPDESVDLIVTSPPYYAMRDYRDGDGSLAGQIGSEASAGEFIDVLTGCTAEWMRVLKPSGSMFVNLGDKYGRGTRTTVHGGNSKQAYVHDGQPGTCVPTGNDKSLLGLPWRYALACTDDLRLILRAEIIWQKVNGLPESVNDRVRRSHEQIFHFTKQDRYYTAVDEIRAAHVYPGDERWKRQAGGRYTRPMSGHINGALNPLGKLPGSVWDIPSQPLAVPGKLAVDHFAAFPMELPRRIILGWSPPGICLVCGAGRFPVSQSVITGDRGGRQFNPSSGNIGVLGKERVYSITGYACTCTPYTSHPGTGEPYAGIRHSGGARGANTGSVDHIGDKPERTGPWREYHLDQWDPPPTRPAVILDPFGGTGTTAIVAHLLGRTGISADLSADYCRIAQWRTTDPGERAKALGVPKPPPVPDNQPALFSLDELEGLR